MAKKSAGRGNEGAAGPPPQLHTHLRERAGLHLSDSMKLLTPSKVSSSSTFSGFSLPRPRVREKRLRKKSTGERESLSIMVLWDPGFLWSSCLKTFSGLLKSWLPCPGNTAFGEAKRNSDPQPLETSPSHSVSSARRTPKL